MDRVVAADEGRENRQVGVIDMQGRTAQWTGKKQYGAEKKGDWVHMRKGATFAVQGNSLVSTKVVDAVADTFQASEGLGASARRSADRSAQRRAAARGRRPSWRDAVGSGGGGRSEAGNVAAAGRSDRQHQRL